MNRRHGCNRPASPGRAAVLSAGTTTGYGEAIVIGPANRALCPVSGRCCRRVPQRVTARRSLSAQRTGPWPGERPMCRRSTTARARSASRSPGSSPQVIPVQWQDVRLAFGAGQRLLAPDHLAGAVRRAPQRCANWLTTCRPRPLSSSRPACRSRGSAAESSVTSQTRPPSSTSRSPIMPWAYRTALVTSSETSSSVTGMRSSRPQRCQRRAGSARGPRRAAVSSAAQRPGDVVVRGDPAQPGHQHRDVVALMVGVHAVQRRLAQVLQRPGRRRRGRRSSAAAAGPRRCPGSRFSTRPSV